MTTVRDALAEFTAYVIRNYPPGTIISDPAWHAPRLLRAARAALAAPPQEPVDGAALWLWRNGDHFLAFKDLYPCESPHGDPLTLGEPAARAIFLASHNRAHPPAAPEPAQAAPDMLAALILVVSVADRSTDEFAAAHRAIAKATEAP